MEEITIELPPLSDRIGDFEYLFGLYNRLNRDGIRVHFDFSKCDSFMHNTVAFLGGLVNLINIRSGEVYFDWDTLSPQVYGWLSRSGFLKSFGVESDEPEDQYEVLYNEHRDQSKDAIMEYLVSDWLGRG